MAWPNDRIVTVKKTTTTELKNRTTVVTVDVLETKNKAVSMRLYEEEEEEDGDHHFDKIYCLSDNELMIASKFSFSTFDIPVTYVTVPDDDDSNASSTLAKHSGHVPYYHAMIVVNSYALWWGIKDRELDYGKDLQTPVITALFASNRYGTFCVPGCDPVIDRQVHILCNFPKEDKRRLLHTLILRSSSLPVGEEPTGLVALTLDFTNTTKVVCIASTHVMDSHGTTRQELREFEKLRVSDWTVDHYVAITMETVYVICKQHQCVVGNVSLLTEPSKHYYDFHHISANQELWLIDDSLTDAIIILSTTRTATPDDDVCSMHIQTENIKLDEFNSFARFDMQYQQISQWVVVSIKTAHTPHLVMKHSLSARCRFRNHQEEEEEEEVLYLALPEFVHGAKWHISIVNMTHSHCLLRCSRRFGHIKNDNTDTVFIVLNLDQAKHTPPTEQDCKQCMYHSSVDKEQNNNNVLAVRMFPPSAASKLPFRSTLNHELTVTHSIPSVCSAIAVSYLL
jgi:hypothetical protein